MSVIVGSMTTVNIGGTDGHQSVNWAMQIAPNRLWQLGSWDPYRTQVTKTITVNVTTYAGTINSVLLSPSTSCSDSSARKDVSISVDACGPTSAINFSESGMFLMSYSYSKGNPVAFGTESWSFQKWVDADASGSEFLNVLAPTYVIQGRAEGSRTGNVTDLGVVFQADGQVTGQQGSVSAGFPGLGNADDTTYGLVTQVGGGTLEDSGKTGEARASVPHSPLYLG